ncbi:hypothetical protein CRUP_001050 [Coryphaenoides rupestris]|nr:hypothetical protein CRUP_001050 [Coryphaenoides rupestris]
MSAQRCTSQAGPRSTVVCQARPYSGVPGRALQWCARSGPGNSDNLNVFLKACKKLGLKEAQLFHPVDLQDLSSRVTVKPPMVYCRSRDPHPPRPQDTTSVEERRLGVEQDEGRGQVEGSQTAVSWVAVLREAIRWACWSSDREELGGGGGGGLHSWCSDAEADPHPHPHPVPVSACVGMTTHKESSVSYGRALSVQPKTATQFNQFLPTKDKPLGYVPTPLRKKRAERHEDSRRSWASPMYTEDDRTFTRCSERHGSGGSDSADPERPDPDLVLDDLASRRFHSPSPAPPTNFTMPIMPASPSVAAGRGTRTKVAGGVTLRCAEPFVNAACCACYTWSDSWSDSWFHYWSVSRSSSRPVASVRADERRPPLSADSLFRDSLFRDRYGGSDDDDDDEVGYADPVQDDLYSRKVGLAAGQLAGAGAAPPEERRLGVEQEEGRGQVEGSQTAVSWMAVLREAIRWACWSSDREELGGGGGGGLHSWCSDAEADPHPHPHPVPVSACVGMTTHKESSVSYGRALSVQPKTATQFNQFLPTKDKPLGYVPTPLRKKRAERHEDSRRSWASPMYTEDDRTFTSGGSDSADPERPDPDLVLDDLASRRFHSPSPAPPTNFTMPIMPASPSVAAGRGTRTKVQEVTCVRSEHTEDRAAGVWMCADDEDDADEDDEDDANESKSELLTPEFAWFPVTVVMLHSSRPVASVRADERRPPLSADSLFRDSLFRDRYGGSDDDDDDEVGYADPVQDDLYSRKVGLAAGQLAGAGAAPPFLPKFWTPEEDVHIQKIKLGSQRRPWYRKMQGFSPKKSPGSSSDDSDSDDVKPWLSSGHSPSGPSPGPTHSHSPNAPACTITRVVGKSLHTTPPPTTAPPPPTPRIQLPYTECTPPVYARMDPTAGPKLDLWEPPDPVDYESIAPNLSNDDMFSRHTLAFRCNTDLALLKTRLCPSRTRRHLFASQPELNIVTQAHARLLCPPCSLSHHHQGGPKHRRQDTSTVRMKADPVSDDMLVQKLGACSEGGGGARSQSAPSVPTACSEGDLQKWRSIRESGQLRFKKRLMVERLAAMRIAERHVPKSPHGRRNTDMGSCQLKG